MRSISALWGALALTEIEERLGVLLDEEAAKLAEHVWNKKKSPPTAEETAAADRIFQMLFADRLGFAREVAADSGMAGLALLSIVRTLSFRSEGVTAFGCKVVSDAEGRMVITRVPVQ